MSREAGFTLTETLVAVALLAMIAAAATPAVRGAVSAHARITQGAQAAEAHLAAEQVLRDLLGAAVRADHAGAAAFTGEAGGFSFLARPGGGAPMRVQVLAVEGDLQIAVSDWPSGTPAAERFRGGFTAARLHYFGAEGGAGAPAWTNTWRGPAPPRLVVLDMAPAPDGGVRRMEIAVGARADLACDYDSGLQACREGA